jgi:hypothetical protein
VIVSPTEVSRDASPKRAKERRIAQLDSAFVPSPDSPGSGRVLPLDDFGGDGARTMVLVYRLPAAEAIYQRFGGIGGSAYFVGGFGMTALTANDIVLVPIRSSVMTVVVSRRQHKPRQNSR